MFRPLSRRAIASLATVWMIASLCVPVPRAWGETNPSVDLVTREGFFLKLTDCDDTTSTLRLSRDGGATWEAPPSNHRAGSVAPNRRGSRIAGHHASIVQLGDGTLLGVGSGRDFGGRAVFSRSDEFCYTWRYEASPFPAPGEGQRAELVRMHEGPLLYVAPHTTSADGDAAPVFVALSFDEGATWPVRKAIPLAGIATLPADWSIVRDGEAPIRVRAGGVTAELTLDSIAAPSPAPLAVHASQPSADARRPARLPVIFADGMVLQRDIPVPIWGWATPGEAVAVTLGSQSHDAVADDRGAWRVTLDPLPAGGPHVVTVRAGGETIQLEDVLVGEVWLCGGQSNMEWTLRNTDEYGEELEASRTNPLPIRQIKLNRVLGERPADDAVSPTGWVAAQGNDLSHFTAVGYHFARRVYEELGVPVGLINSNWGGSRIEPWIPRETFDADPQLAGYAQWLRGADVNEPLAKRYAVETIAQWTAAARESLDAGQPAPPPPAWPEHPILANRRTPTCMYNGMVAPVAGYGLRGFLFYQGEANRSDHAWYRQLMASLIDGWRSAWQDEALPFYFVQVAPYRYADWIDSLPHLQDAQRRVLDTVPNTGMAVISDVTDLDDIHPRRKREVGYRLARWALADTYGVATDRSGPLVESAHQRGREVVVTFREGDGLTTRDGQSPTMFELADDRRAFLPAEARIVDGTIVLTLPEGLASASTVRFAWRDVALPNLIDGSGLPASPFQCDVTPEP